MERKATRPAKLNKYSHPLKKNIIPPNDIQKPTPYNPPLEARPKIIQNIRLKPPVKPPGPPPLNYIMQIPRRITPSDTADPTPIPITTSTSEPAPVQPDNATTVAPVSTVTPSAGPGSSKPNASAPGASSNNKQLGKRTEKDLLNGIVVPQPTTNRRHFQYLIQRPKLPSVQVTVLNKEYARIRCCGQSKVVRMTKPKDQKP